MDINADAQEVVKALGDRIAALSIEVEILRTVIKKLEKEVEDERAAANNLAERLLKYVLEDRTKMVSIDQHDHVQTIEP